MTSFAVYCIAALGEIAGCFCFWAWLRLGKSPLLVLPGLVSLAAFAFLLTRIDVSLAGRAYAAYGGIYIIASLIWMWTVEEQRPDQWDVFGSSLCLVGAAVIVLAHRSTS